VREIPEVAFAHEVELTLDSGLQACEIDRGFVCLEQPIPSVPPPSKEVHHRTGMGLGEAEEPARLEQPPDLRHGFFDLRVHVVQATDDDNDVERFGSQIVLKDSAQNSLAPGPLLSEQLNRFP
jgi:hypothetical protein